MCHTDVVIGGLDVTEPSGEVVDNDIGRPHPNDIVGEEHTMVVAHEHRNVLEFTGLEALPGNWLPEAGVGAWSEITRLRNFAQRSGSSLPQSLAVKTVDAVSGEQTEKGDVTSIIDIRVAVEFRKLSGCARC